MESRNHPRERMRGIVFMLAAVCIFSAMDALMKLLSAHYAPLQIACLRSVSSLVCLMGMILWQGSWRTLGLTKPWLHLFRACLGIIMLASFVFAVHRITLAQAYSVFLAAPLLMTALSVPLHGERVAGRRWLAILLGLSGVFVALQPWAKGAISLVAASAAAIATVCYCLSALTLRSLGARDSSLSMVFWYLALVGLGSAALSFHDWQPILSGDWKWLAAIGVSGGLGQLWLTEAFRRAPPSVVGPFEYTSIFWAFVIDWIFWSAAPSTNLMIGAAIVIASGIFIIWDEHRLGDIAPIEGDPAIMDAKAGAVVPP